MVGRNIFQRLLKQYGTQAAAAAALGVNQATFSRYLSGKVNPSETIKKLAKMLLAENQEGK